MSFGEHLFTCAICRRDVQDWPGRRGPSRQIAPVCRYCERTYGDRAPQAGAFTDRRKAVHISALAAAINAEANAKTWKGYHDHS